MPRPKRFSEASKVLTLRVPRSRFEEYKARFNFQIDEHDKGEGHPFKALANKAFQETDNLIASIRLALSKKGSITIEDFNYLIKHTDFGHNKKLRKLFKE